MTPIRPAPIPHRHRGPGLRITIALTGIAQVLILCAFIAWCRP